MPGYLSAMVNVTREFTVRAEPAKVIDYLKDFSHAEEWDPGTVSCVRQDSGEIRVGSRWANTSKLMGNTTELEYELLDLNEGRVRFQGTNSSATSQDIIDVQPAPEGSQIRYEAVIEMKGAAKLAGPALKVFFEVKLAKEVVDNLTRVLEEKAQ